MFGGLFVKVWRVAKLFTNTSMKKIKISNRLLFGVILRLLLVGIVILMVWTIVSPPKAVTKVETEAGVGEVQYVVCESDKSFLPTVALIWKSGLILYGCYLAYLTRNVDSRFSESKHIFLAIYNVAFVGGLTLLVSQYLGVETLTAVLLQALGTVWCSSTSLVALFVPKLLNLSAAAMSTSSKTGGGTQHGGASVVTGKGACHSDEVEALKLELKALKEEVETLRGGGDGGK